MDAGIPPAELAVGAALARARRLALVVGGGITLVFRPGALFALFHGRDSDSACAGSRVS